MKIGAKLFRGEMPRLAPQELPENAAQEATNCRLQSGDIESWRQFFMSKLLANTGPVQTIYLLNGAWLSWDQQVDVARGLIAGDNTFRVYLTSPGLYSTPRFTNYALATTGAEPYPVTTRPLGVPAPNTSPTMVVGVDSTPTTYSVDTTDAGAELATKWTVNPPLVGSRYATVTQGAGFYLVTYDENRDPGQEAYAYRNFGIAGATAVQMEADFFLTGDLGHVQASIIASATAAGAGISALYQDGTLFIRKTAQWGAQFYSAVAGSVAVSPALIGATTYNLRLAIVANEDGSKTVTASIYNGAAQLATLTATNNFDDGDYCGFANGMNDDAGSQYQTRYDNIRVRASGNTSYVPANVATSYVYTFINDLGEESAPSPTSLTVLRPDGVAVTVTTPTTTPGGTDPNYNITTKWIYRAVTGSSGTVFVFVGTTALATATFVDSLDDSEIADNNILESEEWDVPPTDMQGIIALPNGIMAGFRRNQLCLSVAGRPQAWPVRFRKTIDVDIVAIANIDNTVVIGTKSHVYTCTGNSPDSYSMSKPGAPQSCVAKQSMVFVDGVGVVFASPDGWQLCTGSAGQVQNVSGRIFTKRQWESYTPSSIIAASHDGVLFWWSTGQTPDSGFALDVKPDGFGLIRLSHHAVAAHVDPLTDSLYLVLDVNSEPTDTDLPVASTAPTITLPAKRIYQFDSPSGSGDMVFRWKGRLYETPYPLTLKMAQVRAAGFTNLLARVYANGSLLYEKVITNAREYTLPYITAGAKETYEIELMGTSRVRSMQVAEDVQELG